MTKTDSPYPPGEPARWRSSPPTTQKQIFTPSPLPPLLLFQHHYLRAPYSSPPPQMYLFGSSTTFTWAQGCIDGIAMEYPNRPTVGPEQHLWCVYRFSLCKWVDASVGTTRAGARMHERQVFEPSPTVVCRSVLSSEQLVIELLRCHAEVCILTSAACSELSWLA